MDGSSTRDSILLRIARHLSARRLSAPWVPPVSPKEATQSAPLHLYIRDDNDSNSNSKCKQSEGLSGSDNKECPHEDMFNVDYPRAIDILGEFSADWMSKGVGSGSMTLHNHNNKPSSLYCIM